MPQRIQRKRTKGWRMPEGAIYVGRPTKWGNPWTPANYIFMDNHTLAGRHATAEECVALYRKEITCRSRGCLNIDGRGTPEHGWTIGLDPTELRGHDLACWCPLDSPCHADVLLELANDPPSNGEAL